MTSVRFVRSVLSTADLLVDAIYEGGRAGNAGDDPLGPLLGVSNQGGFRHLGRKERPDLLVITTSMSESDWPDYLDLETGLFTYFGDNRSPGRELHGTPRWGNLMLRDLFARAHAQPSERPTVAPVLVFRTAGTYRDVRFLGLAVPGARGMPATEDLVAVWRHSQGQRFQNYRAVFSILDTNKITRRWLNDVRNGESLSAAAPAEWTAWVNGGQPNPLRSVPTIKFRTRAEQLPESESDARMISAIYERFKDDPYEFEGCAAQIAEMLLPGIVEQDVTRRSRDGGRDTIGKYRVGSQSTGIKVDFALEAKCYALHNAVGVRETSRLISRLRHRQFGILIMTSYLHPQAYEEIIDDQHPILVMSARDIVAVLKTASIRDVVAVREWLEARFPHSLVRLR